MKPVAMFDMFAGGGGAAEGAIQAGAIVPLAWECWFEKVEPTEHQPALDVHQANHPETKVRKIPIGQNPEWEVKILRRWFAVYRARGYHIHLHGSPPCQALSNASTTDASEGMGLVHHFLWLVKETQPDSWSMENVVPMRKRLPEHIPASILNAADFGVPQTRRRCFAGEGWEATPTHTKDEWVSVLDALPHISDLSPIDSMSEHYKHADKDKPYPTVTSQSPKQLRLVMDSGRGSAPSTGRTKDGKKGGGSGRLYRSLEEPSYTIKASPRSIMVNNDGCGESMSRHAKSADAPIDGPSLTVRGAPGPPSLRITDDKPKATKIRSLTIEETAILQGFPSDYNWEPAKKQKYRWTIIGNAVAPPVMAAVIRGIQHG